jgi:Ser/Thr protein kinase RdoA (MazF antagonist)
VAALGFLLYSCAVQAPGETRTPDRPAAPLELLRVEHVLEGYRRHQTLTPAELEYLPDAVRFRPAVVAARELAEGIERGTAPDPGGWWERYAEADAVATHARRSLERG